MTTWPEVGQSYPGDLLLARFYKSINNSSKTHRLVIINVVQQVQREETHKLIDEKNETPKTVLSELKLRWQ